jgi:hypothetical protein
LHKSVLTPSSWTAQTAFGRDSLAHHTTPHHYGTPLNHHWRRRPSLGIAKTTAAIKKFITDYREAGQDLRIISSELFAVQNILDTVCEELDGPTYIVSPRVEENVAEAAKGCSSTITEIQLLLLKYITESKRQKIAWALYAQDDLGKLRRNLDSHKATLNLALTRLDK